MTILHVRPKFNGLAGDTYEASFWWETDTAVGPGDEADVSGLLTDALQDMYDQIVGQVRTAITAIEYAVAIYDLVSQIETHWFDGNWTFTGTNAAESFPPQVAATVSAYTIGGQRPAQKRMIPFSETMANNGNLVAGALANLALFGIEWSLIRTSSLGVVFRPGILSTWLGLQFRELDGTIAVRGTTGTVRSRKAGVGS